MQDNTASLPLGIRRTDQPDGTLQLEFPPVKTTRAYLSFLVSLFVASIVLPALLFLALVGTGLLRSNPQLIVLMPIGNVVFMVGILWSFQQRLNASRRVWSASPSRLECSTRARHAMPESWTGTMLELRESRTAKGTQWELKVGNSGPVICSTAGRPRCSEEQVRHIAELISQKTDFPLNITAA